MTWRPAVSFTPRYRASLTYTSGAHNMKVGFDEMHNISDRIWWTNNQGLSLPVQQRRAESAHDDPQRLQPGGGGARRRDVPQDQWTTGRFTVQGGLRFDWGSSSAPEQTDGPDLWIPVPFTFPAQDLRRVTAT